MTTITTDQADLIVPRHLNTEQQLAIFICDFLSHMAHSYDPTTDTHKFEPTGPIVMTSELKGMIDAVIDSIPDAV